MSTSSTAKDTGSTVQDTGLVVIDAQHAQLVGNVDRLVGKSLIEQGRRFIAGSNGSCQFDLAAVGRASSVGVALMLDWLRYAKRKQVSIEFTNVPEKMRHVIEFSGLTDVISLK